MKALKGAQSTHDKQEWLVLALKWKTEQSSENQGQQAPWHGQGWLCGCVITFRELVSCTAGSVTFFSIFQQGALHCHFAMGLTNNIACPGNRKGCLNAAPVLLFPHWVITVKSGELISTQGAWEIEGQFHPKGQEWFGNERVPRLRPVNFDGEVCWKLPDKLFFAFSYWAMGSWSLLSNKSTSSIYSVLLLAAIIQL